MEQMIRRGGLIGMAWQYIANNVCICRDLQLQIVPELILSDTGTKNSDQISLTYIYIYYMQI